MSTKELLIEDRANNSWSRDKRRSRTGSLAPSALGSGRAGSIDLLGGVGDELQGCGDGEMKHDQ